MSMPKSEIIVAKGGKFTIEGMEKTDQCFKLNDLANMAGKVLSVEKKDHVPVYHDVHNTRA